MKRINELRKMLIVRVTQSGMTTETKPKKKKKMVPLALESTLLYRHQGSQMHHAQKTRMVSLAVQSTH